MKTCITCKIEKELREFPPNKSKKDGLNLKCRECYNEYMKDWYSNPDNKKKHLERVRKANDIAVKARRQFIWDYLSNHPCSHCEENDPVVLQFDHIIREDKFMEISAMVNHQYAISSIKKEIDKCRVLCANCHMRVTAEQLGWYVVQRGAVL